MGTQSPGKNDQFMKFASSSWIWTFYFSFWHCEGYFFPIFMFLEFQFAFTDHVSLPRVVFKAIQSIFSHLDTGHWSVLSSYGVGHSEMSLKQFCKMITSVASWPLYPYLWVSNNSSNYVGLLMTLSIACSKDRNLNSRGTWEISTYYK